MKPGNIINILNPSSIYVEEIASIMGKIVKKKPRYTLIKYKPRMKENLKITKIIPKSVTAWGRKLLSFGLLPKKPPNLKLKFLIFIKLHNKKKG